MGLPSACENWSRGNWCRWNSFRWTRGVARKKVWEMMKRVECKKGEDHDTMGPCAGHAGFSGHERPSLGNLLSEDAEGFSAQE